MASQAHEFPEPTSGSWQIPARPGAMSKPALVHASTLALDVFWTTCLVGIWYFGNFQFGFGLKRHSKLFQAPQRSVFLVWVLFAVGWAVAAAVRFVYLRFFAKKAGVLAASPRKDEETAVAKQRHDGRAAEEEAAAATSNYVLTVVTHTLGLSFTCLAFIAGSVPVVQVFKSLAPIFTTMFSMCYLNAVFPYSAVAAVTLLVAGATMSSWNTPGFNLTAVLLCMVTNLALPLRNVMVKQRTSVRQAHMAAAGKALHNSMQLALDTAVDLNFGGMVIMTPLCLVFMHTLEVPSLEASTAVCLGMHRIVYEIASLMVLARIDAVMHGSLDVLKRAAMTLVALSSFQTVHPVNLSGSVLAFGTLLWYKLSVSKQAAGGATGRAFCLPERWRARVGRLLKFALVCATTFAMRLYLQTNSEPKDAV